MMQNSAAMRPQAALNAVADEMPVVEISGSRKSTESVVSDALTSTDSSSSVHNSPEPSLTVINGVANIAITESNDPNLTPSENIPDTINDRPESSSSSEEPSSSFVQPDDEDPPSVCTQNDTEKKTIPISTTTPTIVTSTTPSRSEPDSSGSHTCEKVMEEKDCETRDDQQATDDEDGSCMTTIAFDPAGSDPSEDTACQSADEAKDFKKECELCHAVFPINEIVSMLKCTHTCCLECAKEYFTQQVTNHTVTSCNCPFCKEPDLNGPNVTEDDVLEYFSNLDILLRSIVDETVHDLFQRKIRDRTLTQDPNFKWCVHCSSGLFALPEQCELTCPDCGSSTCASCRKPWESQHERLSCEKYAEWKEANDPKQQTEGVQRFLQAHGISCPRCQFRFELVRGGCMHFTCTQCKFEFCYGCNNPFMTGAHCRASPHCANLGLHAHHPRNCLFYLRDKEPWELENLLKMNNVPFDTEPSEAMKQEQMNGQNTIPKCPIPLLDTICSAEVEAKHAGLCRTHYIEYLVGKVSKAQIDPLPIMDLNDCVQELRRRGKPVPERGPYDNDQIYREKCQQIIKYQVPLNNR